jgi:hypothetical protein
VDITESDKADVVYECRDANISQFVLYGSSFGYTDLKFLKFLISSRSSSIPANCTVTSIHRTHHTVQSVATQMHIGLYVGSKVMYPSMGREKTFGRFCDGATSGIRFVFSFFSDFVLYYVDHYAHTCYELKTPDCDQGRDYLSSS